jgi:hypothetical protein
VLAHAGDSALRYCAALAVFDKGGTVAEVDRITQTYQTNMALRDAGMILGLESLVRAAEGVDKTTRRVMATVVEAVVGAVAYDSKFDVLALGRLAELLGAVPGDIKVHLTMEPVVMWWQVQDRVLLDETQIKYYLSGLDVKPMESIEVPKSIGPLEFTKRMAMPSISTGLTLGESKGFEEWQALAADEDGTVVQVPVGVYAQLVAERTAQQDSEMTGGLNVKLRTPEEWQRALASVRGELVAKRVGELDVQQAYDLTKADKSIS